MKFLSKKTSRERRPDHKGFTLIEFIVIISIFAIMASVALFNFSGFQNDASLNNLAHDLALTIRQAQVFGWSTLSDSQAGVIALDANGNPVHETQGIFFPTDQNGDYETQFTLYAKAANSSVAYFDPNQGSIDTVVDTIKIQGANHIAGMVTGPSAADLAIVNHEIPSSNVTSVSVTPNDGVSISFSRPRPEAGFWQNSAAISPNDLYLGIYIAANNDPVPQGGGVAADHVVIVSRFGEIEVQ